MDLVIGNESVNLSVKRRQFWIESPLFYFNNVTANLKPSQPRAK